MTVQERVCAMLADYLAVPLEEVTPAANMRDAFDLDSLDIMELGMACEEEFGVELSDQEIRNLKTVDDIIQLMISKGCK